MSPKGGIIYEVGREVVDMFVLVGGLIRFTTDTSVGLLYDETVMKRLCSLIASTLIGKR